MSIPALAALAGASATISLASCGSDAPPSAPGGDAGSDGYVIPLPSAPQILGVRVEGGQIRQGSGAAPSSTPAVVYLSGAKLDEISSVTVGDALRGTIVRNTSAEIVFAINVPHGAPLGVHGVKIVGPGGTASVANAVTITPITVAPTGTDGGPDAKAYDGTNDHPFRSLKRAFSLAQAGDTVLLKDGVHEVANDDAVPRGGEPNVPAGITIKGQSAAAKLVGPRKVGCAQPTARYAFVLAGDTQLQGLDVSEFCTAILAKAGTVSVRDVRLHDMGEHGIQAMGTAKITLENVDAKNNAEAGLMVLDTARVTVVNGHFIGNGSWGIHMVGVGPLTVTGTEIGENGSPGDPESSGIWTHNDSAPVSVSITNGNFHDNPRNALIFQNDKGGSASVTDSFFKGHRFVGLAIGGGSSADVIRVRGSTFVASPIYLNGAPVDFGTPASPGGNTFEDMSIDDDRGPELRLPVTVSGNVWRRTGSSQQPPAGCWAESKLPFWHLSNPGSCSSPATDNVIIN
ncbi:right-handed parallel beta-helix repeat-containing protein [Pendulispora albinea]|uniref:Right-handed parallel beta-helix repeat-containing protein n=1 Tax=Pendulispora albinea TaxID=2741071 RepID=A0ABZ2LZA1_9BACT